jgi:SagB-type dehydrogenase family enzyme
MEERRTIRKFSDSPIALADLSELLWRTVRLSDQLEGISYGKHAYESARGPVPSGGGLHAIDTWVATSRVEGAPPAWWWYDPWEHELIRVNELSTGVKTRPAMLRFTVRHARTSWKYSGFAHALELKDMGAIMMALQLAAMPIGLGAWLLGSGPTAAFAHDLGIDLEVDHPIGEVYVGNRVSAGLPTESN